MKKKLLAVASGGGHWVQLLRMSPAFAMCDVAYITVQESYRVQIGQERFYVVMDATRWNRWRLIFMVMEVAWIVLKERPDIVISTGAAPGVAALRMGKFFGAKTIWVDSIANVESMSLSGMRVREFADLWISQWPDVAEDVGSSYKGAVL